MIESYHLPADLFTIYNNPAQVPGEYCSMSINPVADSSRKRFDHNTMLAIEYEIILYF